MNRCILLSIGLACLTTSPSVFGASSGSAGTGPSFKGPIGLQLYSLRAEFTRNVPATVQKVKNMGFKYVELAGTHNLSPDRFKTMLADAGLKPVSGHFPYERYKADPDAVAKEAKALGLEYAGCAWIPHQGDFDEAECRDAIATFNKAGEALKKQGIKFFYHVHGYEFLPHGKDTLLDLLIRETKPGLVCYEMDILWVVNPGHDPVAWMKKYPKRWELIHLKDLKKGVKGNMNGTSDVTNDVVLGTGQMNWPAILKAARKIGVKYYFIEDESPTAEQQVPQSLKFLENVSW
ncbi:MAG: sugar phosphate isomerase/epimerase [Verrucomicrobia bacterium]|nr:sugar phosphate isomerase/epimerase [Verrucomicrobiota bacterium]MBI3868934.1 sugar phosphate isomerase/epimerase [Verrucomicrobiota bacterium]